MSRTFDEVERATDAAAHHAWKQHGHQGMYSNIAVDSEDKLRAHIAEVIRDPNTECFRASNEREIYYHRETNSRICLNYRAGNDGTCLIARKGYKEIDKQYTDEFERHINAGCPIEAVSPVMLGGIFALHPELERGCDHPKTDHSDSSTTPDPPSSPNPSTREWERQRQAEHRRQREAEREPNRHTQDLGRTRRRDPV